MGTAMWWANYTPLCTDLIPAAGAGRAPQAGRPVTGVRCSGWQETRAAPVAPTLGERPARRCRSPGADSGAGQRRRSDGWPQEQVTGAGQFLVTGAGHSV